MEGNQAESNPRTGGGIGKRGREGDGSEIGEGAIGVHMRWLIVVSHMSEARDESGAGKKPRMA